MLRVFAGPQGRYYSKARGQWKERERELLYALRRGPRCCGRAWERLKWKSRVISRLGSGKWGVWEGDGNGITEAVMDVAGPEARCEQAEE